MTENLKLKNQILQLQNELKLNNKKKNGYFYEKIKFIMQSIKTFKEKYKDLEVKTSKKIKNLKIERNKVFLVCKIKENI